MQGQHSALARRLEAADLSVEELTAASKAYSNLEKSVSLIVERDNYKRSIADVQELLNQETTK